MSDQREGISSNEIHYEYSDAVANEDGCDDALSQEMGESPGGTKIWVPKVDSKICPKVGDVFSSVESVENMYRKYGDVAGFDIRMGTKKLNSLGGVQTCYFVCSKEACLKVHDVKESGRYEVYHFIEGHNHMLYCSDEKKFTRSRRQLDYKDRRNVYHASSSKVGITQSRRMQLAMNGGLVASGGTARDHMNFRRDIMLFVGNKDAQMLTNKMSKRREHCPEYFFEYKCDEKELIAIFWADKTTRMNYKHFGDTISFDATFRTNKHAMIFVPFVAIDNHKKSVVVGASLIRNESVVNFTWVLNAFMKAHGSQPQFVITDQCAAMKQAIPIVFPKSIHRLCMWHITKKVKEKICDHLAHGTPFKSKFNKLVWNVHISRESFEDKWNALMDEYGLRGHSWFEEMYAIRESWIPAYFKEYPMSGLMRTTSRSESINSFFNVYTKYWNDLVYFLNTFDDAIESQRKEHCSLEVATRTTIPKLLSPSKIEAQAAKVYTKTIFFDVQKEMNKAVWFCGVVEVVEVGEKMIYSITHKNKNSEVKATYKVVHDVRDESFECSCNHFVRNGILCRHAFKVMLNSEVQSIPEKYILPRWRRELVPIELMPAQVRYSEMDVEKQALINQAISMFDLIIGRVRNDKGALTEFVNQLERLGDEISADVPILTVTEQKRNDIEELLCVTEPESVDVLPPTGVRNKGCGTGKRLVGVSERVSMNAKKQKRLCRTCDKMGWHDSRNCPMKGDSTN
ncbi:protein FAR1-RELATED SEQUENCE 5-like [Cynara cardunculus var. scolymus]|uniref:protein FAR1-RELATED SEQUENCE 5-like n=1 Tax=Cynara cardunculus var. scolymus TaxID=59895 RepID=UPI000D62518F|nr:protein FAR1-RELATED SEQUENCE 5-like [Cynara cardunculus var. scolymus]